MSLKSLVAIVPFLIGAATCSAAPKNAVAQNAETPQPMATETAPESQLQCPLQLPDTRIQVRNRPDGVAIVFVTSNKQNVSELQKRVQALADEHNKPFSEDNVNAARNKEPATEPTTAVPFRAVARNVKAGSHLILTPLNLAQLEALRSFARSYAERPATGECRLIPL